MLPSLLPTRLLQRRACIVWAATALAFGTGCAEEDNLSSFDVSLVDVEDCSQVGQGAVNCEDPETLNALERSGRWHLDDRGGENFIIPVASFILTDENGTTLAGVHLPNNGTIETLSCTGQGGECYVAQEQRQGVDAESGCAEIVVEGADFFVIDGALEGMVVYQRSVGFDLVCDEEGNCQQAAIEGCETYVSVATTEVRGSVTEDAVLAREVFGE